METQDKKVQIENKKEKRWRKREKSFVVLNVEKYLAIASGNPERGSSVKYRLVDYLNKHRNSEFYNLDELAAAMREEYGYKERECTKSAVCKAVNEIQGDLIFSDGTFYFAKEGYTYKLRPRFAINSPELRDLFRMKKAFKEERVFCIGDNTVVFKVNPEYYKELKAKFLIFLGPQNCFGIMGNDEHLMIMLNEESLQFNMAKALLLDFFNKRKTFEKKEHDKRLREQAAKRQDEEIRAQRKKGKELDRCSRPDVPKGSY